MRRRKSTFSKNAVKWILIIALLDLQLSYLLAFLGREEIAETLSITIVTEIVAVMLGYFMKAYFETKEAEKVRLTEQGFPSEEQKESFLANAFEKIKGVDNDVAG